MSAKKILVVDDDAAVLAWLQAKLGARYELLSTHSPHDVLRIARQARPDLIVCDVDMPEMDGGDVSAALYGDDQVRDIPLLFLTGHASPEGLEQLQGQLGGRPAVSKQAPIGQLLERIASLLQT
jgi:CheY-like chemotaxis protein